MKKVQRTNRHVRLEHSRMGGLMLLFLLASLWEILSRSQIVNSIFLPPPTKILLALWSAISSTELPKAVLITLVRCALGYGLAVLIAIPLGIVMGRSRRIYYLIEPLVETLRPIPSAAIIPVAIVLFGIADQMKIAVIAFGSMWPVLLNTIHGVQTVDPMLIDTGRTFNFNRIQFLQKIIIPASLPNIATGLRISLAISLILVITVEMIAGSSGLGFLILDYERSFKYPFMYAGILVLGIIGFLLNALFVALERRYLSWSKYTIPSA